MTDRDKPTNTHGNRDWQGDEYDVMLTDDAKLANYYGLCYQSLWTTRLL